MTVDTKEVLEAPELAPRPRHARRRAAVPRSWALGVLLVALALAVVFANAPGSYIVDNRFEWYWSPSRVLSRLPWLWDSSRGLGRPRGELSLFPWAVLALFRGLGAGPAVAERLWHAGLLASAGMGTVVFLRCFRPRVGPEHVGAALFAMFSPYTAVFLIPSGLFLNYALAPWLLVAFVRGVRSARPWGWAAVFALLVLASGSTDPPGLFYALALFAPTALYLWLVPPRTAGKRMAGWLGRAGLLSLVVSAAALTQIVYGLAGLSTRLFLTESVQAVQRTTSWAESWRGLGFWASYFAEGGRPLRPEHAPYFRSTSVILATFLPACAAVASFGWSRWRPRFLMVALALLSLTLMVASFPPDAPSPLGRLLLEGYDRFPSLTALRTSYKAGAGLAIGVGCLLGVGVAEAASHLRRWLRVVPVLALLAVIATVSFPFWTGGLYPDEGRMDGLPGYWRAAVAWLDRQPGDTRVLVVPGTSNSLYRWGNPGDDIFDALLARPHVVDTVLPLSTAQSADLVDALDDRIGSGHYRPGTLAPIARRLGIEYVVIRNDLDWERLGRARPAMLHGLREDPDLTRAADFGRRGENVVAREDRSRQARAEAHLPPVEIFRVGGVDATPRVVPLQAPLLVSGNGEAWWELAGAGLLDGTAPVRYSGATGTAALGRLVGQGTRVAVTDTNRRRDVAVTRFGDTASHTLSAGEDLSGRVDDLFARPGSQTVAVYPDAKVIGSTSTGGSLSGYEPWSRPANAFDGEETTWWLTEGIQDPVGHSVWVELDGSRQVSRLALVAGAPVEGGRRVTLATVRFSDGSAVTADLTGGRADLVFEPRRTTSLEVRIDAVEGGGLGAVGFSEISAPPLDLVEVLQLPDDVFRAADGDHFLRESLASAPVTYLFERAREADRDLESAMRRRFRSVGERSYSLKGSLTPSRGRADDAVGALLRAEPGGCVDGIITVDGRAVPVRLSGPVDELLPGPPVPFTACAPVRLGPGWHRLDTGPDTAVDSATLTVGTVPAAASTDGEPPGLDVVSAEGSHLRVRVRVPEGGALLVSGQSYDAKWGATVGGRDLGPPLALDTQAAWVLREEGVNLVDLRYRPQGVYRVGLSLTLAAAALCVALAVPWKRRR